LSRDRAEVETNVSPIGTLSAASVRAERSVLGHRVHRWIRGLARKFHHALADNCEAAEHESDESWRARHEGVEHVLEARRNRSSWVLLVALIAVQVFVGVAWDPGRAEAQPPTTPPDLTLEQCLTRRRVETERGLQDRLRVMDTADNTTYDIRQLEIFGYQDDTTYPLQFGRRDPAAGLCIVGGKVTGTQSSRLEWWQMKREYNGTNLWVRGEGTVVWNYRCDNTTVDCIWVMKDEDQVGTTLHGIYATRVRDDCISNIYNTNLVVRDSLFDGCYTGLSQRGSYAPTRPSRTVFNQVLMKLLPQPYSQSATACPRNVIDGKANGGLWKWDRDASPVVIRNSIFYVSQPAAECGASMDFPDGTYENVTLVWTGAGSYPGELPARGVTVTRDVTVYQKARIAWLQAHGYACTTIACR
jgi:hypothetical protein